MDFSSTPPRFPPAATAMELQDEDPQPGWSGLYDPWNGRRREETPFDLFPPEELYYNTEDSDHEDDIIPAPVQREKEEEEAEVSLGSLSPLSPMRSPSPARCPFPLRRSRRRSRRRSGRRSGRRSRWRRRFPKTDLYPIKEEVEEEEDQLENNEEEDHLENNEEQEVNEENNDDEEEENEENDEEEENEGVVNEEEENEENNDENEEAAPLRSSQGSSTTSPRRRSPPPASPPAPSPAPPPDPPLRLRRISLRLRNWIPGQPYVLAHERIPIQDTRRRRRDQEDYDPDAPSTSRQRVDPAEEEYIRRPIYIPASVIPIFLREM